MPEDLWEREKLALRYAAENRKTEIALLWSRSLYFWGFIAVVLVAYGGALQNGHKNLALVAACFGVICSLCWTLANRSGAYWQRVWEIKAERFAASVVGDQLFPRASNPSFPERWFWGPKQYSPTKLAIAISDLAVLMWLILAGAAFVRKRLPFDLCVVGLTAVYAVVVLLWSRSGPSMTLKQAGSAMAYRYRWLKACLW